MAPRCAFGFGLVVDLHHRSLALHELSNRFGSSAPEPTTRPHPRCATTPTRSRSATPRLRCSRTARRPTCKSAVCSFPPPTAGLLYRNPQYDRHAIMTGGVPRPRQGLTHGGSPAPALALADAEGATALMPESARAHYRKARALLELCMLSTSVAMELNAGDSKTRGAFLSTACSPTAVLFQRNPHTTRISKLEGCCG
jgi:hypothetical protein